MKVWRILEVGHSRSVSVERSCREEQLPLMLEGGENAAALVRACFLDAVRNADTWIALPFGPALVGFLAAAATGFLALRLLLLLVSSRKLWPFALYCLALTAITLGSYALKE